MDESADCLTRKHEGSEKSESVLGPACWLRSGGSSVRQSNGNEKSWVGCPGRPAHWLARVCSGSRPHSDGSSDREELNR